MNFFSKPVLSGNMSAFEANGDGDNMDTITDNMVSMRALVSTKEAGIIIGKGGKNVSAPGCEQY